MLLYCHHMMILVVVALYSGWSLAEGIEIRVSVPSAVVYSSPEVSAKPVGKLKRGKKIQAMGPAKNGFYRLRSRSGRKLFIQSVDVEELEFNESDLFEVNDRRALKRPQQGRPRRGPYVSWDLGFSSGSVGDVGYSEANLGINIFFKEWIAWRNAGFYRFVSLEGVDDIYGLDSMARFYHRVVFSELAGMTFFGGPGVRFVNEGDNVPFAEAGLVLKIAGLSLGGGFKKFFTTFVDEDAEDDTQFFIVLSGSGII